jgi:hypothetical protein
MRTIGEWKEIKSHHKEYHKQFLDRLGKKLNFQKIEDWYNLTQKDLGNDCKISILPYYGSIPQLLKQVYAEHSWNTWEFKQVPKGYWEDEKNKIEFLNWLGIRLGFKMMEDRFIPNMLGD